MAILLVVLLLLCCFGGCWGSFQDNVRGFCADGINCGFSPFRKKKKVGPRKATAVLGAPKGSVVMSRIESGKANKANGANGANGSNGADSDSDDEEEDSDPLRSCCGVLVAIITLGYCCGMLKPENEGAERHLMLPKSVVAQRVPRQDGGAAENATPGVVVAVPRKKRPVVPGTPSVTRVVSTPPPVVVAPGGSIQVVEVVELTGTEFATAAHLPFLGI